MNITEVRVKQLQQRSDRLRAFCSITIDDELVVHDLRVIEGRKGLFVAMPSRKITDNCPSCSGKNPLRAAFCNSCGTGLDKDRAADRQKCHVDVAHPIVTSCRDRIKNAVLETYRAKCEEDGETGDPAEGSLQDFGKDDDDVDDLMDVMDDFEDEEESPEDDFEEDSRKTERKENTEDFSGGAAAPKEREAPHGREEPRIGEGKSGGGFGDGIL